MLYLIKFKLNEMKIKFVFNHTFFEVSMEYP